MNLKVKLRAWTSLRKVRTDYRLATTTLKIFLAAGVLLPTTSHAKPHDLNLVLITGPYAINDEDVNQVVQLSAAKLSEAGIGFKRIRRLRLADKCEALNHLSTKASYFSCQRKALQKYKFSKNKGYLHFIVPPMIEGTFGYLAGISEGRCVAKTSRSYSISNAIAIRKPSGLPGLPLSGLVMTHEIGHSTGAGHDAAGSLTVMDPNAGAWFNVFGDLPWSQSTKNQIKRCIR